MESERKTAQTSEESGRSRGRFAKALIAAGVLVWPAWGALWLFRRAPNVGLAVVSHLALVIPGGMLMRASKEEEPPALVRRKRLGTLLITFGVLAWVPYFIAQEMSGREIESIPFLVWHLSGVVPGGLLRYTRIGLKP